MGWRDWTPDFIEDGAEKAVEGIGDGVEWLGDKTADLADKAGLEDAGDWVRDKSRSLANQLGADVAELELDQTEDPTRIIYGSVSKIRENANHLAKFQANFDKVGNGIKGLDSSTIKGRTATAFGESTAKEPPKWFKAADAFEKAHGALTRFAETVEWAQGQAKEAIAEYKTAKKASEDARTAYNDKVDQYNDAVKAKKDDLPPRPDGFKDPGAAGLKAAYEKVAEARKQRNEAAETARSALAAARDMAPPKPSYAEQLEDGFVAMTIDANHLVGGVVKGTAGLLNFVRSVNPTDPYNLTHPAEYLTSLNSTAAGLVTAVNDPVGTAKTMVDQFMKDPSEGLGKLIPELVGTKGLGALKKTATVARVANDIPGPGRGALRGEGPHQSNTKPENIRSDGTDPVDLATGRMYLPQTDVVLPGVLPLVFKRHVKSGYSAGRWFGPSWTSTVDQRLELDAEGVVFISEDGLLLQYPHPAPGVPVLPESGPRWPLSRTPEGDYMLTDPDDGHTRLFDGAGRVIQIDDRNGNSLYFEYDGDGTPLGIAHSGAAYHLRFASSGGRITALSLDGGGHILSYGYDGGHLTEVTNTSGLPLRFTYDERGRVASWTDTNGHRYSYAYDDEDRCVAEGGEDGHLCLQFSYDAVDSESGVRVTTVTDTAGHTRRYLIDERYRVSAEIDPLGAVTRYTYDKCDRLVTHTDPLGRATRFTYDEAGRLVSLVRPDGLETNAEYDERGKPVRVRHPDGTVVRQTFDERGNRTSVTHVSGATTHFSYDAAGHLVGVTDAVGARTHIDCDEAGLALRVTGPVGAVTRYERNAFGQAISTTDSRGHIQRMDWTVEGRLARRVLPDGSTHTWTYDGEGNCLTHTDPLGNVSRFEYGAFDVLTARTGPDGARYEFVHDDRLRLVEVRSPLGLSWTYEYDSAGRLVAETDFDGRALNYEYDATGRLMGRIDSIGQRITYVRDELGRILRKDAAGSVTTYEYDVFGEVALARTADVTLSRLRDRVGNLISETVDGRTLTTSHDALGRRTARRTPMGVENTWSYDTAGRCTELNVGDHAITFTHDEAGNELSRSLGEVLRLNTTWDDLGRLRQQELKGHEGRTLQRREYTYRADGHLSEVSDELNGPRIFDLDAVGRVTAVDAENWSETYAYDVAGNQISASWPSSHPGGQEATGSRAYAGNRMVRAGSVRYEYDEMGRVTLRQKRRLSRKPDTWRYTWDAEDRLLSVVTPDGTVWRYLHDPLGRRVAKQRMAGDDVVEEVQFTWDGATMCEQTTRTQDVPHDVTLTWTHQGLHPLAQTERVTADTPMEVIDERFFAVITDLIGTPVELVDERGSIAWRTRSTLWGTTTWNRDATAYTPLRFPGQYFDPETGLHYNCFRTYDPETARYLSPDPLGLAPAPNPSAYVDNPHTWCDPLGLAPDYTPLRPGYGSQPAFTKDPYHPDVVDRRIQQMREEYGIRPEPDKPGMIGENGTQLTSKTMWNHGPYRIDVENPNPGQRPGQLHFQDQSNPTAKYQYDFDSGKFEGLPRSVEREVGSHPGFLAGIKKGLRALGEG